MLSKLWTKLKELWDNLFPTPYSALEHCMLSTFDNLYHLIDKTYCGFPSEQSDVRIINMLLVEDYTDILRYAFTRLYTLQEDKDSSCSIKSVFGKFLLELSDLKLNSDNRNESPFKNISYFQTEDELFDYYSTYCFKGKDTDFVTVIAGNSYLVLVDSYWNEFLVYRCYNKLIQQKSFFLIDFNTGN